MTEHGSTSAPIRVVAVDDHRLFLEGLTALIGRAPDIEVVGSGGTGDEAVALATKLAPDVVLMDVMMPGVNGIEATRRIVAAQPEVAVVMLTMLEDDDSLFAAMRVGARGYVLKGAEGADVLRSVRAAAAGEALFGAAIARRLAGLFSQRAPDAASPPFPELTDREREVLDRIAAGDDNTAIARTLHISPKTVSNHISNIFAKLRLADRAAAIVAARDAGLGRT